MILELIYFCYKAKSLWKQMQLNDKSFYKV